MNNRLTIQELSGLLAEHTGKDRANAELFLRAFITTVSQAAVTDKIVKVKGLGTFKTVSVDKRESIHVQTGERFLIPAHDKVSFHPDKELRELVNKPFSFFETTELNEEVDFSDLPSATVKPIANQPAGETLPQRKKIVGSSSAKGWISIGVVAIVVAAVFFLYQHQSFFAGMKSTEPPIATGGSLPETNAVQADTIRPEKEVPLPAEPESVTPLPEVLAKVKIEAGSRLTLISLEYYGSKIFWVYLYEFNKAAIKDPNNIPIGTEIQIPLPALYGIDKYSRASVEKASARQTAILSGDL